MKMKHLYLLTFICFASLLAAQCDADFVMVRSGFDVRFFDRSQVDGEYTVSWDFGDGVISTAKDPSHLYSVVGEYEVSLTISNDECQSKITKIIQLCDLVVDHDFDPICETNLIRLNLSIEDLSGVADSVNVFLDDELLTPIPLDIKDGMLAWNKLIIGDGKTKLLQVESINSNLCKISKDIYPINCTKTCQNFNLEVMPIGTGIKTIQVNEDGFSPEDIDIQLGDLVRFIWNTDGKSVTADDQELEKFDTGVRNEGYEYYLSLKNPGIHDFSSRTDSHFSGSITASCPEDNESMIMLTFTNNKTPVTGFYIAVDGFVMHDQVYQYDPSGTTVVEYMMPGDGVSHSVEIIDAENGCRLKGYTKAINCGASYDCRLDIVADQISRCDDGSIDYEISIRALSTATELLEVYQNGFYLGDFSLENRVAKDTITFQGDFILDTIVAYNSFDFGCRDSLIFNQPDCSLPCSMGNLEVYGGVGDTKVLSVDRSTVIEDILFSEVGENILLQWPDDDFIGMRIQDRSGDVIYDSGLLQQGEVRNAPLLNTGRNTFTIYDELDSNITQFKLFVVSTCPGEDLTLNYSFIDTSGHVDGYNVYVDNKKINTTTIPYQVDGENYGTIQVKGGNKLHNIEIRDSKTFACRTSTDIYIPTCEPLDCEATITLNPLDSCYNGDKILMNVEVFHPDPIREEVEIFRNGFSLNSNLYQYDDEGKVSITEFISSDGSPVTYSFQDAFDLSCGENITYQTSACDTRCQYLGLKVENVNSTYLINNPETPIEYVNCQDSMSYIAVSFWEKYSDTEKYYIFIDETYYGTYTLEEGDTLNTIFIRMYGDDASHQLTVQNLQDVNANASATFISPQCYDPCVITFKEVIKISCVEEKAKQGLIVTEEFNATNFYLEVDGNRLDYEMEGDTILFEVRADGLQHYLKVGSLKPVDGVCENDITFKADYCLNCFLSAEEGIIENCNDSDSMIYRITVDPTFTGKYRVIYKGNTLDLDTEVEGRAFDISLLGDGKPVLVQLKSMADRFCNYDLTFNTINCSPIVCEPDFEYSFDGYTGTFWDVSTTSEDIVQHRWEIGGILTFNNLSEISYRFDSLGTYEVCRYIKTDSCHNEICKDIVVKDPCTDLKSEFSYNLNEDTIELMANVHGRYDQLSYDLGDGATYSGDTLTHIYNAEGTYEVCLTAMNLRDDCTDMFCESISIMMTAVEDEIDRKIKIYPNPVMKSGTIHIAHGDAGISSLNLFTMEGRKVETSIDSAGKEYIMTLNESVQGGLYLVALHTEHGVVYKKIVIQ